MKIEQNLLQKIISESLQGILSEEMGTEDSGSPTASAQEQVGMLNQKLQDTLASNEELQARFSELEGVIAAKDAEMKNLKSENENLKIQLSKKEQPSEAENVTQGEVPGGSINTVQESFQISKTKLEEIIKEEMLFAKKQGIL